jgi:hypothetical protein
VIFFLSFSPNFGENFEMESSIDMLFVLFFGSFFFFFFFFFVC